MSRRRGVMSESFKYELAKDLGFHDVVQREGWEGIRTKDAGNMVKRAIQIAEEHLAKQYTASAPASYGQTGASHAQTYTQQQAPLNHGQTNHNQTVSAYNQPSYNQQTHNPVNASQSYMQASWGQNAYEGQQQTQHVPSAYSTQYASAANNYANPQALSSTNQASAAPWGHIIAGSQQAAQAEQRPNY